MLEAPARPGRFTMVYRVTRVTSDEYAEPVSIWHNEARLTPRSTRPGARRPSPATGQAGV
ncbi:hypothetical protein WME73_45885 [Sorangium sp. So ce302]|uniref:hypothetical protein n=1 Tax=Sorangium sp. So ce302 TaxID=3133297 RepID=UPI003F5E7107